LAWIANFYLFIAFVLDKFKINKHELITFQNKCLIRFMFVTWFLMSKLNTKKHAMVINNIY